MNHVKHHVMTVAILKDAFCLAIMDRAYIIPNNPFIRCHLKEMPAMCGRNMGIAVWQPLTGALDRLYGRKSLAGKEIE
jgi:hypothetical protein